VTLARPSAGEREMNAPGLMVPILAAALMAFYVLLPLDVDFPTVPLFERALHSAVVATLVVFCVVAVQSRGAALSHQRGPYSMLRALYFLSLLGSSLRSASTRHRTRAFASRGHRGLHVDRFSITPTDCRP